MKSIEFGAYLKGLREEIGLSIYNSIRNRDILYILQKNVLG